MSSTWCNGLSLSDCLSLSVCLCLCLIVSLSLSVCLTFCICLSLWLAVSLFSLSLPVSGCLSLSVYLSPSLSPLPLPQTYRRRKTLSIQPVPLTKANWTSLNNGSSIDLVHCSSISAKTWPVWSTRGMPLNGPQPVLPPPPLPPFFHIGTTSLCQQFGTRGVMVSTSAFLACHQWLECGFKSPLGLEFSGFSMWHFLNLVVGGFLRILRFPPSFVSKRFQPIEKKLK